MSVYFLPRYIAWRRITVQYPIQGGVTFAFQIVVAGS
jgi:hypothetical protein